MISNQAVRPSRADGTNVYISEPVNDDLPDDFDCTACWAKIGDPCRDPLSGKNLRFYHRARHLLAKGF